MRSHAQQRALLTRLENARFQTAQYLEHIQGEIATLAERNTMADRPKSRQYGRFSSSWTRADECLYRKHVTDLRAGRSDAIDALTRKIERQTGAIAAFRLRYRIEMKPETVLPQVLRFKL